MDELMERQEADQLDSDRWNDDLDALRSELDALAERDDGRWADQRRAIRLRLDSEPAASSPGARRWLRPVWTAPVLAAGLLAVVLLVVPDPQPVTTPTATPKATPSVAADSAAELLRSVEATLAADPAASLAPAGLLVAELEQQYAALQDDEPDG